MSRVEEMRSSRRHRIIGVHTDWCAHNTRTRSDNSTGMVGHFKRIPRRARHCRKMPLRSLAPTNTSTGRGSSSLKWARFPPPWCQICPDMQILKIQLPCYLDPTALRPFKLDAQLPHFETSQYKLELWTNTNGADNYWGVLFCYDRSNVKKQHGNVYGWKICIHIMIPKSEDVRVIPNCSFCSLLSTTDRNIFK